MTAVVMLDRRAGPADNGRRTLAEELRLQLADEIVRGVLSPGAALDESELARRFAVSRTPVREAIRQLAAGGLVEARPHRGAVVARPDAERLIGMFEAMANRGVARPRPSANGRAPPARGDARELRALIQSGDPQRYHRDQRAFHAAIYAGAHNAYSRRDDAGGAGARCSRSGAPSSAISEGSQVAGSTM